MSRRLIWVAGLPLVLVASFVLSVVVGLGIRLWTSELDVSAPHTTLRMGETVQLAVARKTWLGTEPIEHPERTMYITTWESMTTVEPDGRVTGVGTWGKARETSGVTALNGKLHGRVGLSVRAEGPGPSLDFIVDAPSVVGMPAATCCSTPVQLVEGQRAAFRVLRHDPQHSDVTRRNAGTRYTLFFGSGVPNDPNAAQIVGYGEGIGPATFQVDDESGTIVAPGSIGSLNFFTVLVLARNGEAVGWKQVKLVHASVSPAF
jgi:hypothetical protein